MTTAILKSAPQQTGPVAIAEARPKILLVDDRWENLLATEKVLKPLQAEIFKATSGNEALSLVLRHDFAIVLLDVQMPEMDGFETAMLMQEHESMAGVPIIFVTAISKEDKYASKAAEIGAVDYIFKPINPDILKSKVKVYLDLYVQREQIMHLNAVLSQSNEELERFAYICSHDMQEPVRMMNAFAGLLADSSEHTLDEGGKRYLNFILDNARRMQKMISDILTFSRVGREDILLETVDFEAIVDEILSEFEDTIQQSGASVTYGSLPRVETSSTLARVLLQNLIGNALKFQNGSHPPEIAIAAARQGNLWRFSVRDNGIGIDENFRTRIFTIFQRLHRKEDYPGTGIGLSTCRKFIQLCGGDIDFSSVPGRGSTFYFTLPCKEVRNHEAV
ncbi:ATP-binding protein [Novosphingobium sp. ST904]|uniref:sensor histidine kinase n=1 Tax=Novosphingobium sp. ST904 TaxID=1684385 RepID=UPI0006CC153C|nr:ATP-binding protein [Novosphingobium sp. ST904]KPH62581.1 histidine kinase [Novosphingobium sp. ST904]TCM33034.1 phospho-acceptor domain-containing protein [Novosphingobium sp. ST904]